MTAKNRPLYCFFGHHKCATQWVNAIIRRACVELGLKFQSVHAPWQFENNLKDFVAKNRIDFLAYINADWQYVKSLENFRALHVVRDPRDIIVSAYFSHLHSHGTSEWPQLEAHRQELKSLSQDEGLTREIVYRREQFEEMSRWQFGGENILELQFEHLTQHPYDGFIRLFEHFGLVHSQLRTPLQQIADVWWSIRGRLARRGIRIGPARGKLPLEKLLGLVAANQFARKAGGRQAGQEDPHSHYRKGVAGDWQNYFTPEHEATFSHEYPDLLQGLGYADEPTARNK